MLVLFFFISLLHVFSAVDKSSVTSMPIFGALSLLVFSLTQPVGRLGL